MKLRRSTRNLFYGLLVLFLVLTFYSIFNAGNPNSLFRFLVGNASYDLVITLGLGVGIGVLVVLITASREENSLRNLLVINADHIRRLRRKGKTDNEIAESFLGELGSRSGFLHVLAKRRVLRYLSKLK